MTAAFNIRDWTDPETGAHLARMHAALFNTYSLADVVRYLEEKTYLDGDRFTFKDHEFQKDILSDTSLVVNVQKCAQVGMTEAMARYALAITRIMPYFSVIMTMPSAGDASNLAQTRLDPIITASTDLREAMDKDLNNSEVKAIASGLLYLRGCNGATAALSVPADMLIHDEVDRSDPHRIGQYQSRIKHSLWKLVRKFGTPTEDGFGIAAEMAVSMRKRHVCKCDKCNHSFVPSYHTDVVIPGFDGEKKQITKHNLGTIRWEEAVLLCPRCGRAPSLQFDRRQWVVENTDDKFEASGYFVTPFSVPNIVTTASLVKESTKYASYGEFVNQALGETSTNAEEQLTKADVEACKTSTPLDSSELHGMGIDVGQWCHLAVGRITQAGELLVVYKERCALSELAERKRIVGAKYRVLTTVIDSMPETEMVYRLQKSDKNLFAGLYHRNKKLPVYAIKMVDKELREGKLALHRADIHRDLNFDEVMHMFKERKILWRAMGDQTDELFAAHCVDMKRKQVVDLTTRGMVWTWGKSLEGQDHFMHTLGYLHVACRLMPAASHNVSFAGMKIARRAKTRSGREAVVQGSIG